MDAGRTSLKLVFRLPSKDQKASLEVKVQEEIQSFGSSSPIPCANAENMEKLQDTSKDCAGQSRSSRFCIKIRPKIKRVSQETKDDQEQQPEVEKVSEESRDDQEEPKIIETPEIQEEVKKMGASDEEEPKNSRLDDAEATEKKKKKRGFTLALSQEQIEEDILQLLGSNPSVGRPKKRSKASQRRLKKFFPGTWMESLID